MNLTPIQKRFLLFLGGCIPLRLFIVFIAWVISIKYLPLLGYIALLPAIGFFYLFLSGKRQTGLETQGAPIWWSKFRPIHGSFYLLFAIYAIKGIRSAYLFLLADVLIGLMLFVWFHYKNSNFKKVFM
jgi:hypothetical protein